jgi:hypothetical protein
MPAPESFDLESFRASQAEIKKRPFPVRLGSEKVEPDDGGEPYEQDVIIYVKPSGEWTLEAQAALAGSGDLMGFIRDLVGEDNFALMWSYGWNTDEFNALVDAVRAYSGFPQQGNSSVLPGRGSIPKSN